jgi:hypothetical protein
MPCARGCCDTQAEHYRSLHVARPGREAWQKTITDVHDHHTVDVTEHYTGDRQDVTVKLDQPVRAVRTERGRLENSE